MRTAERNRRGLLLTLLLAGLALLSGCSSTPTTHEGGGSYPSPRTIDPDSISDAVPRVEPRSRYGNMASYRVFGRQYHTLNDERGFVERGIASWYGPKFHGKRTSSGEPYDMYKMTAAHKSLPLPSYVEVTNLDNGRRAIVRVNDRGPFHDGRIIDLSYSAAVKLGVVDSGTARVEIRAIDPRQPARRQPPPAAPAPQLVTAPVAQENPAAVTAPAPAPGGNIYLQAGAFASQVNAALLRQRLERGITQAVPVQTSPDPARPLFRVRLGPLSSVESAMRLATELDRLGVTGARVIID